MNAYELASLLAKENPELLSYRFIAQNASIMLRQQADRIAELEKIIQDGIKTMGAIQEQNLIKKFGHPVKQLSDEEIMEIVADKYAKGQGRYADCRLFYIEFARAIIKEITE